MPTTRGCRSARSASIRWSAARARSIAAIGGRPAGILGGLAYSEATRVPDRFFLVTHHDTIVYLDEAAERLGHGPLGIVPLNLVFEPDGGTGRLVFLGQSPVAERGMSPTTAAGDVRPPDAAPFLFRVDRYPDDKVALRANGLYLAADLDGAVRADRTWCRAFEQYRLVRLDTINGLALLQRFSWVSEDNGTNVRLLPQPIDFGANGRTNRARSPRVRAIRDAKSCSVRRGSSSSGRRCRLSSIDATRRSCRGGPW